MKTTERILERIGIRLLWFDSLGAKCASIAVDTSMGTIVIDPGVAEMQPSYPLPHEEKIRLRREALRILEKEVKHAISIVITHYHYDHHVLPSDPMVVDKTMFQGKKLILKNPNIYINESQWHRARLFLSEILRIAGDNLDKYLSKPLETEYRDPVEELEIALNKDFGEYAPRRRELLAKGREWFQRLARELWSKEPWVKEMVLGDGTEIIWGEGKTFEFGDTVIEVLKPWFHGLEYDRTGWITPIVIKRRNHTVFYTSDVMGPIIEDYAEFICRLSPDVVILDGPPTYLFPYMFNRINLMRAVRNAITIVSCKPKLVIYDHHLLRERKWRERVAEVFTEARKSEVEVLTAAEYLGKKPLIDTL